jgi:hypothetical protein
MRDVAERIEALRARQRRLLAAGKEQDLEIAPMAKARTHGLHGRRLSRNSLGRRRRCATVVACT